MTTALKKYLTSVGTDLKAGVATEHTYRPALAALLHTYAGIRAINEPTRIACGAPDFAVLKGGFLVGHIEAKDIGVDLNAVERSPQLKRYLNALPNVILTDYLEFRWYVDGARRETARLATLDRNNKLKSTAANVQAVGDLLEHFLEHTPQPITTPRELAERLARLAHLIREIIITAFETERASNLLKGWRTAFAQVLVADLDQPEKTSEFADMFAQTLAYGLFSARVMDDSPQTFTRAEAQRLVPRTNPFLRKFFSQITGVELEDEPFAGFVEDLVQLLSQADIGAILADFGKRTRQQDPTVHFYETFLAAYDSRLRESRGVYYTPDPIVSFIVRSVDQLLKTRFGLPRGLADTSKVIVKNTDPGLRVKGKETQVRKTTEVHKVLVLDPATGTGTFPYAVVDHIRAQFMAQGNAGMWSGYVREHLLPRIFGFELLMAPYAVAHFKLALQLAGLDLDPELRAAWAYDFAGDERIQVYLTNTLEGPHEHTGLPLFTQFLADESAAASEIKRDLPIMVVVGNPPYSGHSANKGSWIDGLLKGMLPDGTKTSSYYEVDGQPLGERNSKWLQDDYVKFIRFGQWRIEQSGGGILAFISNNGYLDNPTFRGMRQSLMQTFNAIYILDLHGNARKKETAPDGGPDENVFDIMQGVAIGLFVKEPGKSGPAQVYHAELWGSREDKYRQLLETDQTTIEWQALQPEPPFYLFTPQDMNLMAEYQQGLKVTDALPLNVLGFQTHRDGFAIAFDRAEMLRRIQDLRDPQLSDETLRQRYGLTDNRDWQLAKARAKGQQRVDWEKSLITCTYRPFDQRHCYFDEITMDYPRRELLQHVAGKENWCLNTLRQTKQNEWKHALISDAPAPAVFVEIKDGSSIFPLYLYPDEAAADTLFDASVLSPWPPDPARGNRVPNLAPEFVREVEEKLKMRFLPHPLTPSPGTGEGEPEGEAPHSLAPSPFHGEGVRGVRSAAPGMWAKLKPLARQMRHEPTDAEDVLWQQLRNRRLADIKFRRQHTIERFIVDFYAAEPGLVIEVDGPIHDYTQAEDAVRQQYLESQGLRVIRFTNEQVLYNTPSVLTAITESLTPPRHSMERGPGGEAFTPEDILAYIYAIFHSPTYRERYAEFLKIDFPRVPLTSNVALFWQLVALGRELIALHLLESPQVGQSITRYPMPGNNEVAAKGRYPQYTPPNQEQGIGGRVYINKEQYFEGVTENVWEFQVGGYQVLDKWLKDRRGRLLTFDDLMHYQKIVVALRETLRLMADVDAVIDGHGGWPIK